MMRRKKGGKYGTLLYFILSITIQKIERDTLLAAAERIDRKK